MSRPTWAARLAPRFRGELIEPGDRRYDSARRLFNGMIDKRPALIARCSDTGDVVSAVNFGRGEGLLVAIRGGGHNISGLGSCDGGLVIDLGRMARIEVDASSQTVRADAGCTIADLDLATHAWGLATPTGIFGSTGLSGLTLGGGHGYLSRQFGLTIDNLLEADVVLADGRRVLASETAHADLFWALRGGGGNFGVVTSFRLRAHPVAGVYAGVTYWDFEQAQSVMRAYRDFLPTASPALYPFLGLKSVPRAARFPRKDWGRKVCAVVTCFNGAASAGRRELAPLLANAPPPLLHQMAEIPFPAQQTLFDALLPRGLQWYWKGDFVRDLSDAAIAAHIECFAGAVGRHSFMHLYPVDQRVHDVGPEDTAWGARDARWSMVIAAVDPDPRQAAGLRRWGRDYWETVHPFNQAGAYINFLGPDEPEGRLKASYGCNLGRLAEIKAEFDPDNLFRVNQNIRPADARLLGPLEGLHGA